MSDRDSVRPKKQSYGTVERVRSMEDPMAGPPRDWKAMAQSREQLTMDMSKSDSMFSRPTGCHVSRARGFGLLLLFLLGCVGVAYVTYYFSACSPLLTSPSPEDSDPDSAGHDAKVRDVRLPTSLRPSYYKVNLLPHIDPARNFSIDGEVWIDILCLQATARVTIHIKNITIDEPRVRLWEKEGSTNLSILSHAYDHDREFYNISLAQSLKAGSSYRLYIKFQAILSDDLAGFYRSSYLDKATNQTRWIGVTQFQPTDARRAFPCFDEPQLKAEFEVSLARNKSMTTISNMDLVRTEDLIGMDGWAWDHYNRSVPMSTYLVAFAVTDFESRPSDRNLSRPLVRVWARSEAIEQTELARDVGPRILTYFEEYFDIQFPLPKLDMIALTDFGAGAMENWGLITYRETAMLFDPKVSSDQSKQRAAVVISHEIAHQWFGNLVTPSWWSDLWLNEGFASYVEYIGVDHVYPEWKVLDQFVTDEVQDVFGLDALDSSHPISVQVHHPDEINEIFDSISYAKGASIIRMMNHFLTQSTFNKGLTNYLNMWKYNNTEQGNLWTALTDQAHIDKTLEKFVTVGEVMDTWTLQKGFPVIFVDRNYPLKSANFTQSKFSLIRNESHEAEYRGYRWWVPISYASKTWNTDFQKTQPEFWLKKKERSLVHDVHADKRDWLIVNVQETGYYRVNYDEKNWKYIIEQLLENHTVIQTVNRAQVLDDSLNLARASLLSYETAFNVTSYLRNDEEYLPWEAFLNNFHYISTMLLRSPSFGMFKKYMKDLVEKQYDGVGFDEPADDPLLRKYHRINILSSACSVGLKPCIERAKGLFADWMNRTEPNTDNPVPTNMRRILYCNAIRYGGEAEWDFAWHRYLEANVASEKAIILSALSCSKETWILNRYLRWSITPDSGIRKQDSRTVISGVAGNDVGNFLAFNFIRDKWVEIRKYFSTGFSMGRVIKSIASKFNTKFELMELENFKKRYEHDLGSSARAVDQAIETVRANIGWMDKNFAVISDWLERTNQIYQ